MRYSNKVAHYLRSVRESKGYSQEYLAGMIGISQSSYANLESGKTSITIDRLMQIIPLLGIEWLDIIHQFNETLNETRGNVSSGNNDGNHAPLHDMLIDELKSEISFLRQLLQNAKFVGK